MFLTTRSLGDVVTLTLPDDSTVSVKITGFQITADGRIAATLCFDLPDEVLIDERRRPQGLAGVATERDRRERRPDRGG